MKIKKGDQIKIVMGKDRGKTGTVLRALPEENKLVAEGLNLFKKRVRPKKTGQKGETVMLPRPFYASKAMLICPSCKNAVRAGFKVDGKNKIRFCKKCKATF